MKPNLGEIPRRARGKRVHVRLRNGYNTREHEPNGWAADGPGGCRWSLQNDPFDIVEYDIF
jgi:hypothetical protein